MTWQLIGLGKRWRGSEESQVFRMTQGSSLRMMKEAQPSTKTEQAGEEACVRRWVGPRVTEFQVKG